MNKADAIDLIRKQQKFFNKVVGQFKPDNAEFRPLPEMYSVVEQIRHTGLTVHWFIEGAYGAGFNMDFEGFEKAVRQPCTFAEAAAGFDKACDDAVAIIEAGADDALLQPLPENPIFGPVPRVTVLGALSDHTAHHRGSLSVYLRLVGITPRMVYED